MPENFDVSVNETSGGEGKILKVPVLTLSSTIVFPYTLSPLVIEGESSIGMVQSTSTGDRLLGLFPEMLPAQAVNGNAEPGLESNVTTIDLDGKKIATIGVLGRIVKMLRFPDSSVRVLVRGLSRVRFTTRISSDSYPIAMVEKLEEPKDNEIETVAMVRNAITQFQEVISYSPNFPEELKIAILNVNDNVRTVDLIADTINISYAEKLAILTLPNLHERLQLLTILLNREVEVLHLGSEIQSQVHNAVSKSQREFFLREQLKTIKKELGEENKNPDVAAFLERLAKLSLPEHVCSVVKKEIERLEMIPQASGEYNVASTYIDWLLSVPWNNYTEDRIDVKAAAKILDADHYDLKDIKERILEFLAVLQLKKDRKSPILCFVGPPGVGKTSLGQSIARSMGRKFVRMSLGGIKDEAEIRGHRRTYVGALPGRIIQGLKKAGSANPVFMLDEIDKVGNDFRGDPASALLEVLDPQQNHAFNDHYLELDCDLSAVMFIATANILDTIPSALLDRMEIIRLPGYTAMEKRQIARRFLIPRQLKENGLTRKQANFTMAAVDELINYYTREAGVRNLERSVGGVCRKLARQIVEGKRSSKSALKISPAEVRGTLGPRKFLMDEADLKPDPGIVTGLAWTSSGGSILSIEVTSVPGRGALKLTGSLGDVMKESAQAAFSLIQSRSIALGIKPDAFKRCDFHIHVPDGATPKDGPSAGITMATALLSFIKDKPVRPCCAMTGEITLRGKVTPVGGIKEKVIAALRSGIKTIILPAQNEKDLEDIPDEARKKIRFKFVERADEVFDFMFNPEKPSAKKKKKK